MARPVGRSDEAELEVSLAGDPDAETSLRIGLRNTGEEPITVDRELVFLLGIVAWAPSGEAIELEEIGDVLYPGQADLKARLIVLEPGQSVWREVNLSEGFKCFVASRGALFTNGRHVHFPNAGEVCVRTVPGSVVSRVDVFYGGRGMIVRDGLAWYFGMPYRSLGLYDEQLKAALPMAGGSSGGCDAGCE